jgi:endonuclease/exonuclease/phosphatase (EEP) superfamily protein YafD
MKKSAYWCGISLSSSVRSGYRYCNFGKDAHLVLLQEAQTTPELVRFATTNYLAADQVPAFVLPQHPSG